MDIDEYLKELLKERDLNLFIKNMGSYFSKIKKQGR